MGRSGWPPDLGWVGGGVLMAGSLLDQPTGGFHGTPPQREREVDFKEVACAVVANCETGGAGQLLEPQAGSLRYSLEAEFLLLWETPVFCSEDLQLTA